MLSRASINLCWVWLTLKVQEILLKSKSGLAHQQQQCLFVFQTLLVCLLFVCLSRSTFIQIHCIQEEREPWLYQQLWAKPCETFLNHHGKKCMGKVGL